MKLFCSYRTEVISWQKENCCFDDDGFQVRCPELAIENLKITVERGNKVDVFGSTSPDLS
jgi:hypothetical protein